MKAFFIKVDLLFKSIGIHAEHILVKKIHVDPILMKCKPVLNKTILYLLNVHEGNTF